jgi:hypothetical protein
LSAATPIENPITGPPGVMKPPTIAISSPVIPESAPSQRPTVSCGSSAAM